MAGNGATTMAAKSGGTFAPLRERTFRNIWTASLFSNFGQLFVGVGAAWEMTRLSDSPTMVALVQSAMMLPLVLVTLPSGAIADMFDRRKIAMAGLGLSGICAAALAAVAFAGLITPWLLLLFCVLIGTGVALFSPSWQASIPEQVSRENLPAAVGLGSVSYNVARSFGPALGGLIVVAAGAKAVFAITSFLYAPLILAFFAWKREHVPSRLPPERLHRAMIGGARYALHSPQIRTALVRVCVFGLTSATAVALAPLIAKEKLGGDAAIFGIILGAQGVGAVIGAMLTSQVRDRFGTEGAIRAFAVISGLSLIAIGLTDSLAIVLCAFLIIGFCNILTIAMLNVSVQLSAPRWVTARALSLFSSSITAGVGLGAWAWGEFAGATSVSLAFIVSGIASALSMLIGLVMRVEADATAENNLVEIGYEPETAMPLTHRSGPVVIEVEYDVDPDRAREFYAVMMQMQSVRKRIGGFEWSIARDIANPALWTERYHCPTWGDYLRMRDRYTQADAEVQVLADSFNRNHSGRRVRRRLERPFGSVRWKADSYDPQHETIGWMGPS